MSLLGRARGKGADCHSYLPAYIYTGSQRVGHLWCRLWVWRGHLLRLREIRRFLCRGGWAPLVWAKGSGGLSSTWRFLHDLQASGTDWMVVLEARGRHDLPPLGVCEWAPLATLVTSGVGKKKKEGIATEHHPLMLSPPWKHTCPVAATAKCSGQQPNT